ncbi:hypothetical protein JCM9279_006062 [Rhodotorula babjevae]
MSSSDLDLDAPTDSHYVSDKHRKQQQRKAALARLKRSHRSSTRPTPRFLGADDHDDHDDDEPDAATEDVDFEQWERRDLERRRERRAAAASSSASAPAPRAPARESDPALANAFDDLFDLGDDDGIRTGEPALDVDGTGTAGAVDVDGLDAEGAPAKKRRVVAKMDEVRLLGPSGFPRLRDDLKKVRIKGKGHELQDLKRVLSTYQLWAHQMYPKTNFRDTLVTIEKLCHKRTVQRALKEYRDDEKHGRSNADEQRERDAFADLDIPSTGLGGGARGGGGGGGARAPATLPGSRALLAAAGFDEDDAEDFFGGGAGADDDFLADEEALLAELEAEATATAVGRAGAGGAGAGPSVGAGAGPSRARVQLVEEEGFDEVDEVDEDAEAEAAMREAEEALLM